ncbi:proteasome endopeptidase complex, alpha subunit [Methanolacinia petrolearia DSM 11571]|uniref:Proteasome subunit alpha n=1 Tax=Methanolacinia petrolearia (strain DSM 11571 / OCM 486 / SEBR 4847) TaxID=679926 RepID=E1RK02_METP4|nr:archaeal proteasome endopeptidase complex subunit alpha [Methanolacinia petrolearia]ADN35725.1 proteasome endopeptidase complex, alpha subunit [Methanolacinia petrolearia DSM 11571]
MQPMNAQMGGYDRAITVFSPDGRLYQVEYAREAVKRGTTAVGVKCSDGVVLIVDKRVSTKLLEQSSIEKIFKVDDHIAVASSGLVGDARALVDRARVESQVNRVTYNESIDVETLSKKICDHMQTLTQYGGARPYGTALLIAGISDGVPRLFETDPSGTLLEYKASAIGTGRPAVMKVFEEDYQEDMKIVEAIPMGLKALHAATEGKFDVNNVEIGVIGTEDGGFRRMSREEVDKYVENFNFDTPEEKQEEE